MEPAVKQQEVGPLVELDILLEVDCIEMELRRQVLIDLRQPIFKRIQLFLQIFRDVRNIPNPVQQIRHASVEMYDPNKCWEG